MKTAYSKVGWTVGLMSISVAALAGEPQTTPPQEPAGFVVGGVIGGLAAGPIGAVVGAGIGTWLGNRVHKAGEASKAQAQVAVLQTDKEELQSEREQLQTEKAVLMTEKGDLSESNKTLTARLDELSHRVEMAQTVKEDAAKDDAAKDDAANILDGLQGDVLFRTGSADITPEMKHGIQVLAEAVAKSPALRVRVDGYADPRGTVESNLKLSEARANAVRDLLISAGVTDTAVEINAYGSTLSVAQDSDGYAMERRVRLTLQAPNDAAVAQTGGASTPGSNDASSQ
jgi:outer membrane protein OmpA-like peptidoglycan-associated protein